jgi:hypothetical protein
VSAKSSTNRSPVLNHSVAWEERFQFHAKLKVDTETQVVCKCPLSFVLKRDKHKGVLGTLTVDLAQYIGGDSSEQMHLLHDTPTNCSLKVST